MSGDTRSRPPLPGSKRQKEPGSARSEDSSRGATCSTRSSTPLTRGLEAAEGRAAAALGSNRSSTPLTRSVETGECRATATSCNSGLKVDDSRSAPASGPQPKATAMHSKRDFASEHQHDQRGGGTASSSCAKLSEPPQELSEQTKSEILRVALDTLKALNKSSGGRRAYEGRESHVHQVYDSIFRHASAVEELAWQQLFKAREFSEGNAQHEEEAPCNRATSPVNTRCRAICSTNAWQAFKNGRPQRWLSHSNAAEPAGPISNRENDAVAASASCESDSETALAMVPPELPSVASSNAAGTSSLVQDEGTLATPVTQAGPGQRSCQGFERPAAGAGSAAVRRHCQGQSQPLPPSGQSPVHATIRAPSGIGVRLPPRPGTWNEDVGAGHAAQPRLSSLDVADLTVRSGSLHSPPTSAPAAPGVPDSDAFSAAFLRSSGDCRGTSDDFQSLISLRDQIPSWQAGEGSGGYSDSAVVPRLTSAPAINLNNPVVPGSASVPTIVSAPFGSGAALLELPSCSPIDSAVATMALETLLDTATSNFVQRAQGDLAESSVARTRSWGKVHRTSDPINNAAPQMSSYPTPLSPLRIVGTQCRGGSVPVSGGIFAQRQPSPGAQSRR